MTKIQLLYNLFYLSLACLLAPSEEQLNPASNH